MPIASGDRLTPAKLNGLFPLRARKSADETITSSTTVQDDDHLFVTVAANASYTLSMLLIISGSGIWKGQLVFPSGTISLSGIGMASGGGVNVGALSLATSPTGVLLFHTPGATTSNESAWITGDLVVGATGGTFKLQWAQSASLSPGTILRLGSFLELRQYA